MAWVEVEEPGEHWVLTAGIIGVVAGITSWWYYDFCTACFAYLGAGIAGVCVRGIYCQVMLPWEARRAANLVLHWFRERFPNETVESVAVRAVEPGRYVVSVRHGFVKPAMRSYYAIARPGLDEIVALPEMDCRPPGLK